MQEDDIVNHLEEDQIIGQSPYFENQGDDQQDVTQQMNMTYVQSTGGLAVGMFDEESNHMSGGFIKGN